MQRSLCWLISGQAGAVRASDSPPIVDEIAEQTAGIKVGKVNVDEQSDLAAQYGIMSIPTLIVFRNGKAVQQSVGFISKKELLAMLD